MSRSSPHERPATTASCGLCSLVCSVTSDSPLCERGATGASLLHAEGRLRTPTVMQGDQRTDKPWPVALATAAERLRGCVQRHGSDAVAVLCSSSLTLESAWMARQLALDGLGTTWIGSLSSVIRGGQRQDLDPLLGLTASTCTRDDLQRADLVLVVGADPHRTHPGLATQLGRAKANGARVVVLHSSYTGAVRDADHWLDPRRGTLGTLLATVLHRVRHTTGGQFVSLSPMLRDAIAEALDGHDEAAACATTGTTNDDLEALTTLLCEAERVVAVYDLDDTTERSEGDLALLAGLLAQRGALTAPGCGLLLLRAEANQAGIAVADLYDDIVPVLEEGRLRGLLVIGEDPLLRPELAPGLRALETMVVVDSHASLTTRTADVVLPMPTVAESAGTLVACDGRIKGLVPQLSPPAGRQLHDVLNALAMELGAPGHPDDLEVLRSLFSADLGRDPGYLERLRAEAGSWDWRPVLGDRSGDLAHRADCWRVLGGSQSRLVALIEARQRHGPRKEA